MSHCSRHSLFRPVCWQRVVSATLLAVLIVPLSGLFTTTSSEADEPAVAPQAKLPKRVDYNRDILPILSDNCFRCHGPDAETRESGLRLDLRDAALQPLDSGSLAIVPGDSAASELLNRVHSTDPDTIMPPAVANKHLSDQDKQLLKQWIEEGAEYHPHWAFVSPERPAVPALPAGVLGHNAIDAFIADKLAEQQLTMSTEADRSTLLRRVTLDLTGLPPTPEELAAFLQDTSSNAYEKVVDRLLASPRYAEKRAMSWLDLARYADTHGYNNDGERTQWPWRDWVINAFHTNMPYDQFIIEQLAGDLLENATQQQKLATAFGRNHVITSEGGIIEEEYRVEYVADRVHTTATVFLGLSMQCARCHDHKFDPITQRDYFSFFAFFNNVPEKTLNYNQGTAAAPFIHEPSPFKLEEQQLLAHQLQAQQQRLAARAAEVTAPPAEWEQTALASAALSEQSSGLALHLPLDEGSGTATHDRLDASRVGTLAGNANWVQAKTGQGLEFDGQTHVDFGQAVALAHDRAFSISAWIYPTSLEPSTVISKMDEANAYRGFDLIIEQGRPALHLVHHWPDNGLKVIAKEALPLNTWHHVLVTYDGTLKGSGVSLHVNGAAAPLDITTDALRDAIDTDKPLLLGRRSATSPFHGRLDDVQVFHTALASADAGRLANGHSASGLLNVLAVQPSERTAEQQAQLKQFYLDHVDESYRAIAAEVAEAAKKKAEFDKAVPAVMVMEELPTPRQTVVLKRGEYDQPGDPVAANVPASLPPLPTGMPANRLALARWLVDPAHPLTARVAVNRWWQTFFGIGIVETLEDFGAQSSWPSHPELLDWLATELISSGWNVKALHKQMVMSATYRQSSRVAPEMITRDPKNQLLAHGPRYRLPAETVRDNALAISGLLVERVGGPSVYPYQPDGLWQDVSVERSAVYKQAQDENLYRRSMYTFWKRTCPPPSMSTFDAPDRETCMIRRAVTNTPLQALVLMNDPTFVEAARKLAERIITEGGDNTTDRLNFAFRLAVARNARPAEVELLTPLLATASEKFQSQPATATSLLEIGDSKHAAHLDSGELAGWTIVASVILNLDETISKE